MPCLVPPLLFYGASQRKRLTVRITASNRDTEEKESKTVDVIYIGSALSVPVQFPAHTYKQLEAVILTDGKALSLRSSVKK